MHSPEAITFNTVAPYLRMALIYKPARLVYLSSSMHRTGSTDLRRLTVGTARAGASDDLTAGHHTQAYLARRDP